MTDLYLKFADQTEAEPFLYDFVEVPVYEWVDTGATYDIELWLNPESNALEEFFVGGPSAEDLAPGGDCEGYVYDHTETRNRQERRQAGTALEKRQKYPNTDVLGTLYNVDNTDPENPIVTPIPGWHVNLRVDDYDPALDAFKVNPEPLIWRRVWA